MLRPSLRVTVSQVRDADDAVAWLRTPAAIRERCGMLLAAAEHDRLDHFAYRDEQLAPAARYVAETVRAAYPDLDVPYHSRWRHFGVGGIDRWATLVADLAGRPPDAVARAAIDLAVTSVLLDAGAGPDWRYREPETGLELARSEGLAVASFHLFRSGACSGQGADPLRVDADALESVTAEALATAFQAGPANPLVGLEARAALLRRLGAALRAAPDLFGDSPPRPGNLFDHFAAIAPDRQIAAPDVLAALLRGLASIWPGRVALGGVNLGDVWRHSAIRTGDLTEGLVPLHKLSQWLAYSLVEPLEWAGLTVTELDGLTGLAEYRNGGLFFDTGILEPKHDAVTGVAHPVGSEIVVEWRALTVVLLDRLAPLVRAELGVDAADFPLAKVLEGGTWSAGRRIAKERRADGGPPIRVVSDGTVF
jgi:hypothetical protein